MLNCYNCIYLDAENHYCKRRIHNVPGVCPYAEERKPRNHFEMLKAMSMEQMAAFLYDGCCREGEAFPCSDVGCKKCWLDWLKEATE